MGIHVHVQTNYSGTLLAILDWISKVFRVGFNVTDESIIIAFGVAAIQSLE